MTVLGESCRGPICAESGSSPCSSRRGTANRKMSCKRFRSTKGASKARRDHINSEIRSMRALLPIPLDDQERLSYLHSMSAICTFIRKSVFFQELQANGSSCFLPYEDFLQALPGFIVAMSSEGKLIYVSENVVEYLGFSMVDVLQGDTFYDMIENADVEVVKSNLENSSIPITAERAFVCRMHTSKAFRLRHGGSCSVLVRGRFTSALCDSSTSSSSLDRSPAFIALCTLTANRWRDESPCCSTESFQTLHGPDMSFVCVPESVLFHLGYSAQEMIGRSWYSLLHPEDLASSARRHKSLLEADDGATIEMVLRLQRKDLSWALLYVRATKDSEKQAMSCINHIISETEVSFLKQRIYTDEAGDLSPTVPQLFQPLLSDGRQFHKDASTKRLKREREVCSMSEDPQTKMCRPSKTNVSYLPCDTQPEGGSQQMALMNSPVFPATPPYSPTSSNSSPPQECYSDDLFLDSFADTLLSSPECSPAYLPGTSTFSELPNHLPVPGPLQTMVDHTFGAHNHTVAQSPESYPSPSYEFPSCPLGAHLVPDCLQLLGSVDTSSDSMYHSDEFGLPAPQPEGERDDPILDLQNSSSGPQQSDSFLTPDPSPTGECHFQYSESEQAHFSVLAQQISSILSSFDAYCNVGPAPGCGQHSIPSDSPVIPCDCSHPALCPLKLEPVLGENVIDSILQEMELASVRRTLACPGHSGSENSEQAPNISVALSTTMLFNAVLEEPSLGAFPSMPLALDSVTTRPGCHEDNSELYQLSHYLHGSLQPEELAEESMY